MKNAMDLNKKILDFLFPIECLGCGQEDVWLCDECRLKIPINEFLNCLFCGRNTKTGRTCLACSENHFLDGIYIASDYNHKTIKLLIRSLKYNFVKELGPLLGELAGLFLKNIEANNFTADFNFRKALIIPMPLHKRRLNWRGFNQAEIIGQKIATDFDLKISTELLKIKNTKAQAKLKKGARKENIKNCFAWSGENLNGKKILLVDDVATTGTTLNEAAKVLKQAGAKKVWGLVIAKG